MMQLWPSGIDRKKTAMGAESSFSLTRQAQTNRYDRRIFCSKLFADSESRLDFTWRSSTVRV
jgi:hypothetical protein